MDQELLRHFLELRLDEKNALVRQNNGTPWIHKPSASQEYALLQDGKQIEIYQQERFIRVLEHIHDFVEIIYMYAGQNTYWVNGGEILLRTGELLLLNKLVMHEHLAPGEHDITINIVISPQFFTTTLNMMGDNESGLRKFLLNCLRGENQESGYLHFKVADVIPVQNLLENLIWSLANEVQYIRSVNQHTMGLLFLHLLSHTDKAHSGSKKDELTFQILKYVEERYADGSLAELAELLGYDMNWMSRNVKHLTGSNFEDLRQNKRISQMQFLLQTTTLTVPEIARQVGYRNSGYFYRLFRKRTGCSPETYRKENKTSECAV